MKNFIAPYKALEPDVLRLISGAFCLQLINAACFLILNIYMVKEGFKDHEIANFISYRFMAVMFFAVPFGLYLKGKPIKPVLLFSAFTLPIVSLAILEAIDHNWVFYLQAGLIVWGISFSGLFIATLPYILRNVKKENHTLAISLNAATWSIATIVAGAILFSLANIAPAIFHEKRLLQVVIAAGFFGFFILLGIKKDEIGEKKVEGNKASFYEYDWSLIMRVVSPTFMIALGAGLTIPFMNLYFFNVFGMDGDQFSLLGAITSILVAFAALQVPKIKERFGYEAITVTQSLSILALVLLGACEHWSLTSSFVIYLAIFCYLIRQPLMNMANPMTSEMGMYYVGKRNQELVSAINSSIWSGSWFFSAQFFRYLRKYEWSYGEIFYVTAGFYFLGVVIYFFLIKDFRKKESQGFFLSEVN